MTIVMTAMLCPTTWVSTIRMNRVGMLNSASVKRIRPLSIQPWLYPATAPMAMPIVTLSSAARNPMRARPDRRQIERKKISRPTSSVPNGWVTDGGCRISVTTSRFAASSGTKRHAERNGR